MDVSIEQKLEILKKDAIEHRARCLDLINELLNKLHGLSDNHAIDVIKSMILQNNELLKSTFKKNRIKNKNYFLYQFLTPITDKSYIKSQIEHLDLISIKLGNAIGLVVDYFHDKAIRVDGNVIREVIQELRNIT